MESLGSDYLFSESWQSGALVKPEIKVNKLDDEQIDIQIENSTVSSKNTAYNEVNAISSIMKKKLQSELVVCVERLPIVKAERDTNVDNLGVYSLEEEDNKYLIEESQYEVSSSLKRHVKTKPSITDSEGKETVNAFKNSKYNENTIEEKHFVESKVIVQEELDTEDEDDEFIEEHLIESNIIVQEELDIKSEDEGENQFTAEYFDPLYEESRKAFTCRYCYTELSTEKFKNAHELSCKCQKMELEQHLEGSIFECSYCKLLYTREEDKNEHQAICKKRKESEKYKISTTERGNVKYCCDKCNYETQWKNVLVRHISRKHDKVKVPKYFCDQCQYQSIDKSLLKRHLRKHSCFGMICNLCHKSFKHKGNLDAHYVSRHPDRADQWGSTITHKINQCPTCSYKTVMISSFKKHLAIHGTPSEQDMFKCNICGYKCLQKHYFSVHSRIHVGQLPFVCTECGQRFNRKYDLGCHIVSRHSENEDLISSVTSKVHRCDKCNYKTVRNADFKKHIKKCL